MDTESGGVLAFEQLGADRLYAYRLHDEMINSLLDAGRKGNYLLVGPVGSGKTASILRVSDRLIRSGAEHALIPCGSGRTFVPPLARINLVDDIGVFPNAELISQLNMIRGKALNLITIQPPHVPNIQKSLRIEAIIQVQNLSVEEQLKILRTRLSESEHSSLDFDKLDYYVRSNRLRTPRELLSLVHNLFYKGGKVNYSDESLSDRIEIIRPQIITLQKSILDRIRFDVSAIRQLSPTEFELLVGELFEKDGYSIEFTSKTRDGGIDLLARKADVGGEFLTIVQCKRYQIQSPVRVHVVREIIGAMDINRATAAAIFTTSRFTKDAIEEGKRVRYRLSLQDYFDILKCISNPGLVEK